MSKSTVKPPKAGAPPWPPPARMYLDGPQIVYAIRIPQAAKTRLEALAKALPGAQRPRALARDILLRGIQPLEKQVKRAGFKGAEGDLQTIL